MSRLSSKLLTLAALPLIAVAAALFSPESTRAYGDQLALEQAVNAEAPLGVASAVFPPPNPRWLTSASAVYAKAGIQIAQSGQFPYEVSDENGGRDWARSTRLALDTGSSNPNSWGNLLPIYTWNWFPGHYNSPYLKHRFVSNSVMSANCGTNTSVIGCAYWTRWQPAEVFYRAPSMVSWSEESVGAVIVHETHHVAAAANDQYAAGLNCTGNQETVMDCGGAARFLQFYDIWTFLHFATPDHPTARSIGIISGGLRIYWNQVRTNARAGWSPFTTNEQVGTWVVFYFYNKDGFGGWAQQFCSPGYSCMGDNLAGYYDFGQWWVDTFDCVQLRVESRATWWVEQSSQVSLGYAAQAGCWR